MNFIKEIVSRAYNKFTQQRWEVGFIPQEIESILNGKPIKMKICKHAYKDRWFADPFIFDVSEDYIYLLVEELYYKWGRGRISKLTIDRKSNRVVLVEPILQLESHLSFPAIKRTGGGGKIYIYPENAKGQGLAIYEYDSRSNNCEFVKVITPKPLADAIITDAFGEEELYATEIPTHNGNMLNRYSIKGNEITLNGQYCFSGNIARNAGDWFKHEGIVYRPAQDCNDCYGSAVILQEVKNDNSELEFIDVRRIKSTNWKYITGCHTFNHYKGVTVIDVHGYCHPIIGWLFYNFTPKWLLK